MQRRAIEGWLRWDVHTAPSHFRNSILDREADWRGGHRPPRPAAEDACRGTAGACFAHACYVAVQMLLIAFGGDYAMLLLLGRFVVEVWRSRQEETSAFESSGGALSWVRAYWALAGIRMGAVASAIAVAGLVLRATTELLPSISLVTLGVGDLPPELGALELAYVLLACWAWWAVPWSHVWANALVWLCLCCVDLALAGGGWDDWAAQLRGTSFQAIWPLALSMAVAVAWGELRSNWMSLEEERLK